MFRYFVILSFLVGTPGLFADDLPGACTKTWKFTSSAVTASKYDQALITADLNTLQSMLDCVNNASLRLPPDVAAKGVDAKYKAVISDATETNKDAALFKDFVTKLKTHTDDLIAAVNNSGSVSQRTPGLSNTATLSSQSAKLAAAVTLAGDIVTKSATLAQGNFGNYTIKRNGLANPNSAPEICASDITDPLATKFKSDTSKEEESILSQVAKLKTNKTNTKTTEDDILAGDYTTEPNLTDFIAKLKAGEYSSTPKVTTSTTATTTNPATTQGVDPAKLGTDASTSTYTADQIKKLQDASAAAATATQAALDKKTADDSTLADLKTAMANLQLKESYLPASTTNSNTPGTSSGGSAGPVSAQAPQAPDLARDAEKRKWLERAKQAEDQALRQLMKTSLKSGALKGKPAFTKGTGSTFSLRDLFNKPTDDNAATTDKKTKDVALLDDNFKPEQGDKYKKYYKMGKGPDESSSKDLARSSFDSMYESARVRALTEGADTEYAGRYIDPFLLIHSIIDDYYRKGLLVDTAEVISPVNLRK
ncbi:MAG: hypothetical protein WCQ53_00975 [bacterium]